MASNSDDNSNSGESDTSAAPACTELSDTEKAELSKIGFDVVGYISSGKYGSVFKGNCNDNALRYSSIPMDREEWHSSSHYSSNQHSTQTGSAIRDYRNKMCAIKRLEPQASDESADSSLAEEEARYQEIKAMVAMNHPNIVRIYDVLVCREDVKDILFIIMEYSEQTLEAYVETVCNNDGVISEEVCLRITKALLSGLKHIHGMGYTHGDIHLTNVMFFKDDNNNELDVVDVVKYVDFGESRLCCGSAPGIMRTDFARLALVIDVLILSVDFAGNGRTRYNNLITDLSQCTNTNKLISKYRWLHPI